MIMWLKFKLFPKRQRVLGENLAEVAYRVRELKRDHAAACGCLPTPTQPLSKWNGESAGVSQTTLRLAGRGWQPCNDQPGRNGIYNGYQDDGNYPGLIDQVGS